MKRSIFATLAGLAVWVLVASLLNRGLRLGFPGYALAEPTMTFTLGMKIVPLILGALASLAAGAATGAITLEPVSALGGRRRSPRDIHPGTHSTLGEISRLVSPVFSRDSRAACCAWCNTPSEPCPFSRPK
jgi:hypothetical protein